GRAHNRRPDARTACCSARAARRASRSPAGTLRFSRAARPHPPSRRAREVRKAPGPRGPRRPPGSATAAPPAPGPRPPACRPPRPTSPSGGPVPGGRPGGHRERAFAADEELGEMEAALREQVLDRVTGDLPPEAPELGAGDGQVGLDGLAQRRDRLLGAADFRAPRDQTLAVDGERA